MRGDGQRDDAAQDAGFALVSVLWGVTILAVLAAAIGLSGSGAQRYARRLTEEAETKALAEAGLTRAILGLMDTRIDKRWRVDGVPQAFEFDGVWITVSIEDELGKIDLNAASRDTLERYFAANGASPAEAAAFADRVADWRSPDDLEHVQGASSDDYRAAGLASVPRNGSFQSVDELNLVLGMTPEPFARLQPGLTVYSRRPTVERATAPREVLLAQADLDPSAVEAILDARDAMGLSNVGSIGGTRGSGPELAASGVLGPTVSLAGRSFTISAGIDRDGATAESSTVVMLTESPRRPCLTLGAN